MLNLQTYPTLFLHPKVSSHRKSFAVYKTDTKRFQQLFSSQSDNLSSATKMCQKMFVLFAISLCCLQSSFVSQAAEADWEVLNFAISNPSQSNPEVLKNSILNILGSFVPQAPPAAPTTAKPPTLPPAPTFPTPAPTGLSRIFSIKNNLQVKFITAAPTQRPPVYPTYPIYYGPNMQPIYYPQPQPQQQPQLPQQPIQQYPWSYPSRPFDCDPKKKSLAEFLVNVPCPTTTPKPIKQIVVRVPCPTTTQKPCQCQCCPCNPCKPSKAPKVVKKARKESSEEDSHEQKTIYRSYDPIMQKYVAARRNDVSREEISFRASQRVQDHFHKK